MLADQVSINRRVATRGNQGSTPVPFCRQVHVPFAPIRIAHHSENPTSNIFMQLAAGAFDFLAVHIWIQHRGHLGSRGNRRVEKTIGRNERL